jgi:SH3-like domain-containing protein
VLDTVKHTPDTQLKMSSRRRIFEYAILVIILLICASLVLLIGYNTFQRNGNSVQTPIQSSIKPASTAALQKMATVTVRAARLREGPSLEAGIASIVAKGDRFEVIEEWTESGGNKWYKLRVPDSGEYWIASYIVSVGSL